MRVRGDNAPPEAYAIEPQPGRPGYACVRLFANPVHAGQGSHWAYDEYQIVVKDSPNLAAMVETHLAEWIQICRMREPVGNSTVYGELQNDIGDMQAALTLLGVTPEGGE